MLREQISTMIMRGVVKDPRVDSMLSITSVKVSKDLAYADIYVSSLTGDKKLEKATDALNHAAGFIQHKLNGKIRLKSTPILRFRADTAIEHGYDLSKKIDELNQES